MQYKKILLLSSYVASETINFTRATHKLPKLKPQLNQLPITEEDKLTFEAFPPVQRESDQEDPNPFNFRSLMPWFRTDIVQEYGQTCGVVDHFRIVNGEDYDIKNVPWQLKLLICDVTDLCYNCGGTQISGSWVLSAAHCVALDNSIKYIISFFGVNELISPLGDNPYRYAVNYVIHNQYSATTLQHDIAVISNNADFEVHGGSFPACLPKREMCLTERYKVKLTGWGNLYSDGPSPAKLQGVDQYVTKWGNCDWFLNNYYNLPEGNHAITENQICAGGKLLPGETEWQDTCQGDSGGPMTFYDADNIGTVTGIVSWGIGCAQPGFPGIYTRVSRYIDWIYANTQVKMVNDTGSLNACYNDFNEENGGFADLTGQAETIGYPESYETYPQNFRQHIVPTFYPDACLGRSSPALGLNFRPGKMLTLQPNCTKIDSETKWKMNANYEFKFDPASGRIYQDISGTEDYCVIRNKKNAYITKCQADWQTSDVIKASQQFTYHQVNKWLTSLQPENGVWRALYFERFDSNSETAINVKVAPLQFRSFEFDIDSMTGRIGSGWRNENVEAGILNFGDSEYYCAYPFKWNLWESGHRWAGGRVKFEKCSDLREPGYFEFSEGTSGKLILKNSSKDKDYCVTRNPKGLNQPVTMSSCESADEWILHTPSEMTIQKIVLQSNTDICLYIHHRSKDVIATDCGNKNFEFGA